MLGHWDFLVANYLILHKLPPSTIGQHLLFVTRSTYLFVGFVSIQRNRLGKCQYQ